MNIEYAQTIALREILDKAGIQAAGQGHDGILFYVSPLSNSPTLQVNERSNTWYDTHTQTGGDPMAFVRTLLKHRNEHCADIDIMKWLKNHVGYPPLKRFMTLPQAQDDTPYKINAKVKLQEAGLIRYAMSRDIDAPEAKELFKQIYVLNKTTGKEFVALGFKNEDGGFMIYNAHVEASLLPENVSVIRGEEDYRHTIHIFKNIFDFSKAFKLHQLSKSDYIILNTWNCIDDATAYIRGCGYTLLRTWFDNSSTGEQATQAFRWLCTTEENLTHQAVKQSST